MTAPFRYYMRVRYQECDAQHVVFNARYGDYVDLAVTEYLRASFPQRDPFDGSLEFQVVRQLIEWTGPARFNDILEISVRPAKFGTTSFTIAFEIRFAGQSDTIVKAEVVYVIVDGKTWQKRPMTVDEQSRLESAATGQFADHGGYFPVEMAKVPNQG